MNKMHTQVFSLKQLKEAAALIQKGELVAFPTETVYGLGANAFDSKAVRKIFKVKGRKPDNPLIVHVASVAQAEEIAHIPNSAKKLMKKWWPGPLTLVLPKKKGIPSVVTAGRKTVGVRVPQSRVARKLIQYAQVPIAAPSANLSTKPSTTAFAHAQHDLDGKIAGIIRGQPSRIGLESTILDLTGKTPLLLRPGAISLEQIQRILPTTKIYTHKGGKPRAPGMKYKHYAPDAQIYLFEKRASKKLLEYEKELRKKRKKVRVMRLKNNAKSAKNLFHQFRAMDADGVEYILILAPSEKGMGAAILNRVRKAAVKIIA